VKVDYRRFGKYMTLANIFISGLVVYTAVSLFPGEAAQEDSRALFAPVQPSRTAEPKQKSIFRDYSGITVDRFLPRIEAAPGEPAPLVPIPGASSALDRLVKLRGTAVSTEKELSCAILELLQSGESKTVHIGEEVAGAKVLEISDDSVVVTMDNEEITLHLDATEEYGGGRRSTDRSRSSGRSSSRGARRGGSRNAGGAGNVPPAVRRALENLPESARKEALNRWQSATPEQRQKYLQLMESRRRQGGGDTQRARRNPRERR
jgi:hypothetical protein